MGFSILARSGPRASIWVRYALRRDSQDFLVVARTENGDVEVVVLEAIGSDLTNGQFERIDLDLEPLAGLNQVQLRLVARTGNAGDLGVDISRILIGDEENIVSQETPVAWDFDELAPELETISGHWGLSPGAGREGSTGLRLVTRLGLRGLLANDRVRILPPLDRIRG